MQPPALFHLHLGPPDTLDVRRRVPIPVYALHHGPVQPSGHRDRAVLRKMAVLADVGHAGACVGAVLDIQSSVSLGGRGQGAECGAGRTPNEEVLFVLREC